MSLRRLLPDARFVGCPDWEISGCSADSRRLEPGQLFVAVRGRRHDGHDYVGQALERGAAGVVVERPCPEAGRLQVIVPDARIALARLCHALAGDPANQLRLLAVAGLCGRVATTVFIRSIFEAKGIRYGAVDSFGWSDGLARRSYGSGLPGPEGLAAMLSEMAEQGCAGGIVEVPGRALESHRIEGLEFAGAVVTDLGWSHGLPTDELIAQRRLKARLFRKIVSGGAAVVNADDPQARLLSAVNLETRHVTFGVESRADVGARIDRLDTAGSRFRLRGFDREATVQLRLMGSGNVSHALAAAAVAWSQGIELSAVVAGLESVTAIPGRMIEIVEGQDFTVLIDQAQTGAELREALSALRAVSAGKIHCVVGAEGCQDRAVRLALADAAECGADRITFTCDNPRTEDPNQIFDDLLAGLHRPARVRIEPDRRQAIEATLSDARAGDAVLIAGKGHRTFQIFADRAERFDDREVAQRWLRTQGRPTRKASA